MEKDCTAVILILVIFAILCIAILNMPRGRNRHNRFSNFTSPVPQQARIPTYWGSGIPLTNEMRFTTDVSPEEKIPTISGNGNIVGPQCCPSAYSTSSGCVCPLLK